MSDIAIFDDDHWVNDRMQIAVELSLLGLTEEQMCAALGISMSMLSEWKKTNDAFKQALLGGKAIADAKVAVALYKRAVGYDYDEERVGFAQGEPVYATIRKHMPPDPWSAARWLSLRQRGLWSETQKVEITNTNVNINKFDFTGISDEDLMVIKKLGLQQLRYLEQGHGGDNGN